MLFKKDKTTASIHRYSLKMQRITLTTAVIRIPGLSNAKPALILFKGSKSNLLQKNLVITSVRLYQAEKLRFT